jgi:hypothetical protein
MAPQIASVVEEQKLNIPALTAPYKVDGVMTSNAFGVVSEDRQTIHSTDLYRDARRPVARLMSMSAISKPSFP